MTYNDYACYNNRIIIIKIGGENMRSVINTEKLTDVQTVATKLKQLPEKVQMYIAGYTEGVLAMANSDNAQSSHEHPGKIAS